MNSYCCFQTCLKQEAKVLVIVMNLRLEAQGLVYELHLFAHLHGIYLSQILTNVMKMIEYKVELSELFC